MRRSGCWSRWGAIDMSVMTTAGAAGLMARMVLRDIELRRVAFVRGYVQALQDVPKAWWMRPFQRVIDVVILQRAHEAAMQYDIAQWTALMQVRRVAGKVEPDTPFLIGDYEEEVMRMILPDTFDGLVASASKYMR